MKHAETHPGLNVEGCFGCKVASTSFGSNSTTTRGAVVADTNKKERGWQKDMPAYKRLRADGLQPRQIDGCAEIEKKATTTVEVETGRVA